MALPIILFNTSTGSDTAASGAGPAGAITGTAAAHTNGSSSTTITLTNGPDLTNVANDGSHTIWLKTPSGRQWSRILDRDNTSKTLTVEDNFNVASGSAVNYAIGGKRNSWNHADNRLLFTAPNVKPGWTIETETDQTLTGTDIVWALVGDTNDGPVTVRGSAEHKVVSQSANNQIFSFNTTNVPTRVVVENLKFQNTNASKSAAHAFQINQGLYTFRRCIFGDATHQLRNGITRAFNVPSVIVEDSEFKYCQVAGINLGAGDLILFNCWIHHCTIYGVVAALTSNSPAFISNCVITHNGTGVRCNGPTPLTSAVIENCVIDSNTGTGIDISAAVWDRYLIFSNQITNNGGYGIEAASGQQLYQQFLNYNNFYGNTSGERLNLNAGPDDLAIDPQYRNPAGGDFSVGAAFRSVGYPGTTMYIGANQSTTRQYKDIGLPQEPGDGMAARNLFLGTALTSS